MKRRFGLGRVWLSAGAALLAYVGLPYLLVQVGNLGLIREGKRSRREVALTFDDGPDPATTPAVLAALEAAGMHATFFVLAERARAHPELLAQMRQAGHQIGVHAARHRHAWLRSPWGAFTDPIRATRSVQAALRQIGLREQVTLHRPPHGAYTLATVLGQRRAGVTGVHWSTEAHDWDDRLTPAEVRERFNRWLVPGTVIVLHDAGPGARTTAPLLPAPPQSSASRRPDRRHLPRPCQPEPRPLRGLHGQRLRCRRSAHNHNR